MRLSNLKISWPSVTRQRVKLYLQDGKKYKDLLESSGEEEEDETKIDLEKQKSNHSLLLVIFESIKDNFMDSPDVETYLKLIRALKTELEDSNELRKAKKEILKEICADGELSQESIARIKFENKGIYDEINKWEEYSKLDFAGKINAQLASLDQPIFGILALTKCSELTVGFMNRDEDVRALIGDNIELWLQGTWEVKTLVTILKRFDVPLKGAIVKQLDEYKYDPSLLDLYLRRRMKKSSQHEKLKYLEEFIKKQQESGSSGLSAVQKVDQSKFILATVVDFVREEIYNGSCEGDKYKYIGQYLKLLISLSKLYPELLEHLGNYLVDRWLNLNLQDLELVKMVGDSFFPLKKMCPTVLFLFLLKHSSSVDPSHSA
jgi:hypothetical protein